MGKIQTIGVEQSNDNVISGLPFVEYFDWLALRTDRKLLITSEHVRRKVETCYKYHNCNVARIENCAGVTDRCETMTAEQGTILLACLRNLLYAYTIGSLGRAVRQ
jgi:hypothetical protein